MESVSVDLSNFFSQTILSRKTLESQILCTCADFEDLENRMKKSKIEIENSSIVLQNKEEKITKSANSIVKTLLVYLGFFVILLNGFAVILFTSKGDLPCFTAWIAAVFSLIFLMGVYFPASMAWYQLRKLRDEAVVVFDERNGVNAAIIGLNQLLSELAKDVERMKPGVEMKDLGMDVMEVVSNETLVRFEQHKHVVYAISAGLGVFALAFPFVAWVFYCVGIRTVFTAMVSLLWYP